MDPKQEVFEKQLTALAQSLDNALEDSFGTSFSLHPNRLSRGKGANPSFDGLFATTIAFTLGYGSKYGRGYVVNVDIRTLDRPTDEQREDIGNFAFNFIEKNLETYVPNREISVVRDGRLIKIIGDFSLS